VKQQNSTVVIICDRLLYGALWLHSNNYVVQTKIIHINLAQIIQHHRHPASAEPRGSGVVARGEQIRAGKIASSPSR